jgi:hypothetical protein
VLDTLAEMRQALEGLSAGMNPPLRRGSPEQGKLPKLFH